jgi:DNA polymerase III delta prime subunit
MIFVRNIQAASGDFPHMLFYGPSGAGKKTRISCTLRQLFGSGVEKVRVVRQSTNIHVVNLWVRS